MPYRLQAQQIIDMASKLDRNRLDSTRSVLSQHYRNTEISTVNLLLPVGAKERDLAIIQSDLLRINSMVGELRVAIALKE